MMRKPALLVVLTALVLAAGPFVASAFETPATAPRGWQLDLSHGQPRTLAVTLPSGSVQWYWYMPYKVVNHSGDDRLLIPEIVIATDAGDIITAGQNVPAVAFKAVEHKLNNPLLEAPSKIVGKILQGEDYARESVAIWPVPAHDVDEMSIFIGGLSGETATTPHPLTGEDVLVRRTRMITYATPGTVTKPQDQPVELLAEQDVMR